MSKYTRKEKSKRLSEVRGRQAEAHSKAREILREMGFSIEKDIGPVSNKPWDFIAKKHGLTYYVDAKSPYTKRGKFTISVSEINGMLKLRSQGIPTYLFILPDGRPILFTAV